MFPSFDRLLLLVLVGGYDPDAPARATIAGKANYPPVLFAVSAVTFGCAAWRC